MLHNYDWNTPCNPWQEMASKKRLLLGVAPANQTKERSVHKSSMWIVRVFLRKNTRIHKNGRNSWTFRFGPFFGLVCRGDSWFCGRSLRLGGNFDPEQKRNGPLLFADILAAPVLPPPPSIFHEKPTPGPPARTLPPFSHPQTEKKKIQIVYQVDH